ncbi:hypothetical protein DM860_015903 [Cuscuta australis]|uniref:Uncharacterized protein n=1 Tax=Cuscuta australis TaxID=267555 RepID=A0A328DZW1_9ASTE|nr:hypothetical protein DM860_015903 [Cuscuta australis]
MLFICLHAEMPLFSKVDYSFFFLPCHAIYLFTVVYNGKLRAMVGPLGVVILTRKTKLFRGSEFRESMYASLLCLKIGSGRLLIDKHLLAAEKNANQLSNWDMWQDFKGWICSPKIFGQVDR